MSKHPLNVLIGNSLNFVSVMWLVEYISLCFAQYSLTDGMVNVHIQGFFSEWFEIVV